MLVKAQGLLSADPNSNRSLWMRFNSADYDIRQETGFRFELISDIVIINHSHRKSCFILKLRV